MFEAEKGQALPFGATVMPDGVNFSFFSLHADAATLVLFEKGQPHPIAEIPFPENGRIGNVFTVKVKNLDYENIEYGLRVYGPNDPENGHRFDPDTIVLDPYAKSVTGRPVWGQQAAEHDAFPHRGRIFRDNFEWYDDRPLQLPIEDLVIYEMHVRGFTRHESSGVLHPGTFEGIREKIPYLKEIGVNAVELMPVFEFDEFEHSRTNPETGEMLLNYWGYSTINFFSPKAGYAAQPHGGEVNELKLLVKTLHENGIEVILDVVFNHTAEGNENGPTLSFKGIDNKTYYMLTPEGYYFNFSGTGNTFNANHPAVMNFIIHCLRYWVTDYHIDGFRFDLASALARAEDGTPLEDPPLMKLIAHDPILGKTKLIAEPWDAGGLYHVGMFPAYGRWAEWNGKYRDSVRQFVRGDENMVAEIRNRLIGSPDLYPGRGPIATVNFITAHDGFTLADLVSYNEKHNEANLEDNQDGHNDNLSWNCGVEGPTDDPEILALRQRQMMNLLTILMMSQGVPMVLMGDEVGRSQQGNNNTYCQDNELNWLDWTLREKNETLFTFFKRLVAFRHRHPVLRNGHFLRGEDYKEAGAADITWHGKKPNKLDTSDKSRLIAFMLSGKHAKGGLAEDNDLYVAFNMHWEEEQLTLPKPPSRKKWHVFLNTSPGAPQIICEVDQEPLIEDQKHFMIGPRSSIVLVAK
nr:MAG: glycogen debranching enzyme GlgX [Chloroflexota bacterium]